MMKGNNMKKTKRILQFITGVHRIHHIAYSYGWKLPFIKVAYFAERNYKRFGLRLIKGHGKDYHDCTITGVY